MPLTRFDTLLGAGEFVDTFPLTPQMFGAVADCVTRGSGTDNHDAFMDFFNEVKSTGKKGYIPPGTYRIASDLDWDLLEEPGTYQHMEILGAGISRTNLLFDDEARFQIRNTSVTDAGFYKKFGGFNAVGSRAGIFFYFGGSTVDGAFNAIDLDKVRIVNVSAASTNIACQCGFLYGCKVSGVFSAAAGLGTNGIAIRLVACNFNEFHLFPGSSLIGLDMWGTSYTTAGNVFTACDFEINGTGVVINDAGVMDNLFNGGTLTYYSASDKGIEAIAGARNRFTSFTFGGDGVLFGPNTKGILVDEPHNYLALGNANTTVKPHIRHVATSVAFTAARTLALPPASGLQAGEIIDVGDMIGTLTGTNTLNIHPAGSDTINGAGTGSPVVMNSAYQKTGLMSDGVSRWIRMY